jgi:phosphate:Na+ symporter
MIKGLLLFSTGVIFFILGMVRLSEIVQRRLTNVRIREYFRLSVKTPLHGVVTGFATTILFQSSSATSVLTVGLVSAGLISFYHSLGIILGADIGTTVTVQLVVWKITDLSPIFILVGSLMWITARNTWKYVGMAVFYFGLIFFGLSLVTQATAPLKNSEQLIPFVQMATNPLIGLVIGLAITAVIQSSAIPIALLVILAHHGLVTIEAALPVVFGANVGTATTALLASLAVNINGKRSAVAHMLFKIVGVIVCMSVLPFFIVFLKNSTTETAQQIAYGHLFFNVVIVVLLVPFLKPISQMIIAMMPGEEEVLSLWPEYLDEGCLNRAEAAFDCVSKELGRQMALVNRMYDTSVSLVTRYTVGGRNDVTYIEYVVDTLRREIGNYLCRISESPLSPSLSQKLLLYSQLTDAIERIGDHALSLAMLSERKQRRSLSFSDTAHADLRNLEVMVEENLHDVTALITRRDSRAIGRTFQREEAIDQLFREYKDRHLERVYQRICNAEAGPIFVEMLIHLERISDHCENIAEYFDEMNDL